jgi:hypothetical protein
MLWNVELIKKTLISKIWTSSEIMTAKIRNITGMCGRHGNHICPCWKEVLARNAQRWTARRNEFVVACFQKSTKSSLPEIHINSIRTPGQIWISCMSHYGHIGSKSFKSSWPSVRVVDEFRFDRVSFCFVVTKRLTKRISVLFIKRNG